MRTTLVFFAATVLAAGCSSDNKPPSAAQQPAAHSTAAASPLTNGRDIFLTGRDADGHPILAAHRPLRPSCSACHGAGGAGGLHVADHAISADLRHHALVTEQKPPYDMRLLERAISSGVDNTGQPLSPVMPRWRMSSRDLHDVSLYVLTLK